MFMPLFLRSYLIRTAALAKFSENIIVLGTGGSMAFAGLTEHWSEVDTAHQEFSLPQEEPVLEEQAKAELKKPEEAEDEGEILRRQVGDPTLWLYYLRAVGIPDLILSVLLALIATIGGSFPRKYAQPFKFVLICIRDMVEIYH
jgi:hypothetical protein